MLNDAHAEAGQAPSWLIAAQVEVVGTACGTVGTLHIGLAGEHSVMTLPCHPSQGWGDTHKAHLAVTLPIGIAALTGAATQITLALHTGDTRH